jgi:hypothetical protein
VAGQGERNDEAYPERNKGVARNDHLIVPRAL